MAGILISPAEPPIVKTLGRVSLVAERWGADIFVPRLRLGIQRKEIGDFVASLTGDRLAKEVLQMRRLVHRVLVIEGRWVWNADGEWMRGFQRFTRTQYRGALMSLQAEGITVLRTDDVRDTVACVGEIVRWAEKKSHSSLSTRPKFLMNKWGTRDDEDWATWLMQGFDGIGAKVAQEIVKTFGGAPLRWAVSEKELMKVAGVGKERARRLMRALGE